MTDFFGLIITSEVKTVFKGKAVYCGLTTLSGALGLEANHESMLGILKPSSEITYTGEEEKSISLTVDSGMFSFAENTCTILVELSG